jgi:hypothetical protein
MEDMLTWGRQILASQPFSVLLGTELLSLSEGSAELKIPIKTELKQQHGFVHGGVISYAADNALTYAGGSSLGTVVVTSESKLNYVRPAMGEFWSHVPRSFIPARIKPFVGVRSMHRTTLLRASAQLRKVRSRGLRSLQNRGHK